MPVVNSLINCTSKNSINRRKERSVSFMKRIQEVSLACQLLVNKYALGKTKLNNSSVSFIKKNNLGGFYSVSTALSKHNSFHSGYIHTKKNLKYNR